MAQAATPASPVEDPQWMTWAIVAFGFAIALLVVETFVPSGGVLGILSMICALGGVFMFYKFDTMWGMVSLGVTLVAAPFVVAGMLWVLPNTPIARAMTLEMKQKRSTGGPPADSDDPSVIVVGLEGEALTELRPVGACRLKGQRMDCIAHAGVIEAGTKVRVVSVEGVSVKVKPI